MKSLPSKYKLFSVCRTTHPSYIPYVDYKIISLCVFGIPVRTLHQYQAPTKIFHQVRALRKYMKTAVNPPIQGSITEQRIDSLCSN